MTDAEGTSFALALSGGGLLGAAHLGVLAVLQEAGFRPTAVAGTSAGGLVAALVALNVDVRAVTEVGRAVAARPERYFRLDLAALWRDVWSDGRQPATGLVDPASFLDALLRLVPRSATSTTAWRLPCVLTAVDLAAMEAVAFVGDSIVSADPGWVVWRGAPLHVAMQATMAMPGLFAAVVTENRLLVDGGGADTLPVDWAYRLQPGPVLAVDVAAPYPVSAHRIGITGVLGRAEQYTTNALAELRQRRILAFRVVPDTRDVPFFGFRDFDRLVEAGRTAMTMRLPAWRAYLAGWAQRVQGTDPNG